MFLLTALSAVGAKTGVTDKEVHYNRDVRPILAENCFVCHGADSGSQKAKLRLDSVAEATAKREDTPPVVIPGQPDKSEVIRRIFDTGDDLMPPEKSRKVLSDSQKIGSGFNRCNSTSNEGGLIDEEYLVLYARDRTDTTAQVGLGMTAGCAVCHDHKYDPLSQKEFYALSAFFNNTTQVAKDGNVKDTPPILPIPQAQDEARWAVLPPYEKNISSLATRIKKLT